MKMTGKIIAAAAALTICFGAVSPAYAAVTDLRQDRSVTAEIVNFDEIEGRVCSTIDEAALYIREQIKLRNPAIKVIFPSDSGIDDYEAFSKVREKVFEHTGDPKEGDYLLLVAASYASNSHRTDTGVEYTMQINYSSSLESEEKAEPIFQELLTSLRSFQLSDTSDVEKIKKIYDYMTSNIKLFVDEMDISRSSAAYALLNGFSTSTGYTQLLIRLLGEFGYDASAYVTNLEFGEDMTYHALVIVKLNGKNYFLDPVWDSKLGGSDRHRFFLKGYNDLDSEVPEDSEYHHEHIYDGEMMEELRKRYAFADTAFDPSSPVLKLGDVNGDGIVDSVDASSILAEYAQLSSENGMSTFSDLQKWAADIDGNSLIDAVDASSVLSYYAYLSTLGEGVSPKNIESFIRK